MERHLVRTSKFLSLVLRHRPEAIGLELDSQGWASVDQLLVLAEASGQPIPRSDLLAVVEQNDKKRFALSADGLRIRASQGHSIDVDLHLELRRPPETLYHGTVERFLESIRERGLVAGRRQHVHLSADRATAERVGARRGRPVVLRVVAGKLHRSGHEFFLSANGVWLSDHVPASWIEFPE